MENVIKTGIIIDPDDPRDVLTEFENGNMTGDKNYMLPLRPLWDVTPDKKEFKRVKIYYAKNPDMNVIMDVLDNDRVIIAHTWVIRTATPVSVDDLMYFPNHK